ncbi:MAG TPA: hypothetical protein VF285_05150 [Castellaniella sp.]|uniref:hypothetical protein n=1 Tax=Castellaniella sp. TaxID=1955812 RepID=UPI002F099E70
MAATDSVQAAVAQAVGLQNANAQTDAQNALLRKTLDAQAQTITSLVQGAVTGPQKLADSGTVGTQLHTTA